MNNMLDLLFPSAMVIDIAALARFFLPCLLPYTLFSDV